MFDITAIIFSVIGFLALIFGVYVFFAYRLFLKKAKKALGELKDYVGVRIGFGPRHGSYTPKIKFITDTGREILFTSKVSFTPFRKKFSDSKNIPILYDPENPEDAEVDDKIVHLLRLYLLFIAGIFFLAIGISKLL